MYYEYCFIIKKHLCWLICPIYSFLSWLWWFFFCSVFVLGVGWGPPFSLQHALSLFYNSCVVVMCLVDFCYHGSVHMCLPLLLHPCDVERGSLLLCVLVSLSLPLLGAEGGSSILFCPSGLPLRWGGGSVLCLFLFIFIMYASGFGGAKRICWHRRVFIGFARHSINKHRFSKEFIPKHKGEQQQ